MRQSLSLGIEVGVCGGLKGITLTEEEFENSDTVPMEEKDSCFWVQYNFMNRVYKSAVKYWSADFMKEEEVGKCNFALEL